MSLEGLGDLGIVLSVFLASAFIVGYGILAPWYKSEIGRSLFLSKSWTAGLCWLAFFRTTLDIPAENSYVETYRAVLWAALPFVVGYTLWALLWKGQIRRRRRERSDNRSRRDRSEDLA